MIDFFFYIDFFDFSTFRSLNGRSKWLLLLNIIHFFLLFDVLLRGQTDQLYKIHRIILTFWLFDLLVVGQNDQFYGIYCIFLIYLPLGGWSKWSIILNILYFSTFWFFDLLVVGQNDEVHWIYLFFRFFDFWPLAGSLKCLSLLNIL